MNFREQIEEVKPREIEERSFAIISEELGARTFAPHTELIVKRCIHTSADFDYADNLCFSQDAAVKAMEAIKRGVSVVTDTNMAKAGINKVSLGKYGGSVTVCSIFHQCGMHSAADDPGMPQRNYV